MSIERSSKNLISIFSMLALLIVVIYFNIYQGFHFLPLTEGWFSTYAYLVNDGKIPYRDFYLYLTPLYTWIMAFISTIFGPSFFILRIFGVVIIIGISLLLYAILRRQFSPTACFTGSSLAVLYYQSGVAHIAYDFTQVLTFFMLSSGYCLTCAISSTHLSSPDNKQTNVRKAYFHFFLAGLFGCLAFLTKQSNGAFISIGIFLAFLFIISSQSFELRRVASFASFGIGALVPALIVALYLYSHNAINDFFEQIFFNSIDAKGNLDSILFSWARGMFSNTLKVQAQQILTAIIFLIVASHASCWILLRFKFIRNTLNFYDNKIREYWVMVIFFSLSVAIIYFGWENNAYLRKLFFSSGQNIINYLIPLNIVWTLSCIALGLLNRIFKVIPCPNINTISLSIISMGVIVGNGTSAGLSEISAFIGLAWIITWLCNRGTLPLIGIVFTAYLYTSIATTLVYKKFDSPYAWWGAEEPDARTALYTLNHPLFKGIYVSKSTYDHFNSLIQNIDLNKGGSIFSFPNIPLAYLIAKQMPDSKVVIPWYDFLNNQHAIEEAVRLKESPPDLIAYLELPAIVMDAHEGMFRKSKYLGQRAIANQITISCLEGKNYKIILKIDLGRESTLYLCKKSL